MFDTTYIALILENDKFPKQENGTRIVIRGTQER